MVITTLLIGFQYNGDQKCEGTKDDLLLMRQWVQGNKIMFSDIFIDGTEKRYYDIKKFFEQLSVINVAQTSLLLVYFTGHGENGRWKFGSDYLDPLLVLEYFDERLPQDAEIVFLCDCCGMTNNPFSLACSNGHLTSEFIPRSRRIFALTPDIITAIGSSAGSRFTQEIVQHFSQSPYSVRMVDSNFYSSHVGLSSLPLQIPHRLSIVDYTIIDVHYT